MRMTQERIDDVLGRLRKRFELFQRLRAVGISEVEINASEATDLDHDAIKLVEHLDRTVKSAKNITDGVRSSRTRTRERYRDLQRELGAFQNAVARIVSDAGLKVPRSPIAFNFKAMEIAIREVADRFKSVTQELQHARNLNLDKAEQVRKLWMQCGYGDDEEAHNLVVGELVTDIGTFIEMAKVNRISSPVRYDAADTDSEWLRKFIPSRGRSFAEHARLTKIAKKLEKLEEEPEDEDDEEELEVDGPLLRRARERAQHIREALAETRHDPRLADFAARLSALEEQAKRELDEPWFPRIIVCKEAMFTRAEGQMSIEIVGVNGQRYYFVKEDQQRK